MLGRPIWLNLYKSNDEALFISFHLPLHLHLHLHFFYYYYFYINHISQNPWESISDHSTRKKYSLKMVPNLGNDHVSLMDELVSLGDQSRELFKYNNFQLDTCDSLSSKTSIIFFVFSPYFTFFILFFSRQCYQPKEEFYQCH